MSRFFDHKGYKESILYSSDDFEPYGYVQPQPVHIRPDGSASAHDGDYRGVVEAAFQGEDGLDT